MFWWCSLHSCGKAGWGWCFTVNDKVQPNWPRTGTSEWPPHFSPEQVIVAHHVFISETHSVFQVQANHPQITIMRLYAFVHLQLRSSIQCMANAPLDFKGLLWSAFWKIWLPNLSSLDINRLLCPQVKLTSSLSPPMFCGHYSPSPGCFGLSPLNPKHSAQVSPIPVSTAHIHIDLSSHICCIYLYS